MYFWNIKALTEDIRQGDFSDKDVISYIVLSLLLYSISFEALNFFPVENQNYNFWDIMDSFLSIFVPVIGTLYAYKMNGGRLGKDFANKYFSIGFVVGVRFFVYFLIFMPLLIIYWSYAYPNEDEIPTTFVDVLIFFVWYILLYYQIGKYIQKTNIVN